MGIDANFILASKTPWDEEATAELESWVASFAKDHKECFEMGVYWDSVFDKDCLEYGFEPNQLRHIDTVFRAVGANYVRTPAIRTLVLLLALKNKYPQHTILSNGCAGLCHSIEPLDDLTLLVLAEICRDQELECADGFLNYRRYFPDDKDRPTSNADELWDQ